MCAPTLVPTPHKYSVFCFSTVAFLCGLRPNPSRRDDGTLKIPRLMSADEKIRVFRRVSLSAFSCEFHVRISLFLFRFPRGSKHDDKAFGFSWDV